MIAYSKLSAPVVQCVPVETVSPTALEIIEKPVSSAGTVILANSLPKVGNLVIRSSLKASTGDGVFAIMFSNITGGVLLSNFLLQLGASSIEIGMLASVPMLANLLQPLGAYISELTTSRRWYNVCIYAASRLLWLILVLGIGWSCWHHSESHALVTWTLVIVLASNVIAALGNASWLSWMAALVPQRLRGRYFGTRNSAISLTTLLSVPLFGLAVSAWPGGTIQGYGVLLFLGVAIGLISLGCQVFMADVNPQQQASEQKNTAPLASSESGVDPNFLRFLLYFGFWAFAVNVGNPFFNLYLLDNLSINVSWVTLYGSLTAGASLLMMIVWGKLADQIGNRPLLILVGVLVALTPLLWLGIGTDVVSLWVWFPLLHLLMGGTWAAIDLCTNNLQMAVAPRRHQASYFAIAAAVAGVGGALGTTTGSFLAQFANFGGLPGLFALSGVLRLIALLPLMFVWEQRSQPLSQVMRSLLPLRSELARVPVVQLANRPE